MKISLKFAVIDEGLMLPEDVLVEGRLRPEGMFIPNGMSITLGRVPDPVSVCLTSIWMIEDPEDSRL